MLGERQKRRRRVRGRERGQALERGCHHLQRAENDLGKGASERLLVARRLERGSRLFSQRQRHLAARREAAPIAQSRSGLVGHPDTGVVTRAERVGLWNTFFSLDFLAFL